MACAASATIALSQVLKERIGLIHPSGGAVGAQRAGGISGIQRVGQQSTSENAYGHAAQDGKEHSWSDHPWGLLWAAFEEESSDMIVGQHVAPPFTYWRPCAPAAFFCGRSDTTNPSAPNPTVTSNNLANRFIFVSPFVPQSYLTTPVTIDRARHRGRASSRD